MPLNAELYARLERVFGTVHISDEGAPFLARPVQNPVTGHIEYEGECGEYYTVCCPFCGDTRHRLWINHRWCTRYRGRILTHLFVCYNEHCESNPETDAYASLRGMLTKYAHRCEQGLVQVTETVIAEGAAAQWQGVSLPLSTPVHLLPRDNPAVRFLTQRGYNIVEAGEQLGMRWCTERPFSTERYKLLVPLYATVKGVYLCVGAQLRYLNEDGTAGIPAGATYPVYDKKADSYIATKYAKWRGLPGSKTGTYLYNGEIPLSPVVCLVEGSFDVLGGVSPRLGVASNGKQLNSRQKKALWYKWGAAGATLVVAYDGDVWLSGAKKTAKLVRSIAEAEATWSGGVITLKLGPTEDPGKLTRAAFWGRIFAQAIQRGGIVEKNVRSAIGGLL